MNLQIPEGANVQIFIGQPPPLALTDQRAEVTGRPRGRGIFGATLKLALVSVLVIGGFWIGEQRGQAAGDGAALAAPPPVQQTFPSQAAAQPQSTGPANVPPDFSAQLKQSPTVVPPPGQNNGSGNTGQNAFGLQN